MTFNLKTLRKIGIIGATINKEKYGFIVLKNLLDKGYEIYPVNPKYKEILGIKCYKSVKELPLDIDLLVFVLSPDKGNEIVKEALERGFRNFWFQPGAESEEIKKLLEKSNANFVFNKCIMIATDREKTLTRTSG